MKKQKLEILHWEEVKTDGENHIWRARVFRGWLVGSGTNAYTFIPDDNSAWQVALENPTKRQMFPG